MNDYLLLLLAAPLGLIFGMLPGIGATVAMMMLYTTLMLFPPNIILAFYITFMIATQFSCAVAALWLGIMGEPTSLPIMKERHTILQHGCLNASLARTAQGSVLATVMAVSLLFFVMTNKDLVVWALRTETMLLILTTILIGAFMWKNHWTINLVLISVGVILSMVGYNDLTMTEFGTFGISYLLSGIPTQPFLMGMYALPLLFAAVKIMKTAQLAETSAKDRVSTYVSPASLLRGSTLGFIAGLIPWVGIIMSSSFAHFIENHFRPRAHAQHALDRCTAAEAANNAACVSMLLPLFMFGIAISPSEAVILSILWNKNWTINALDFTTWITILTVLIPSIILCWLACTKFARVMSLWIMRHNLAIVVLGTLVVAASMAWIGNIHGMVLFYLATLMVTTVVGMWLYKKNVDVMPLIIGFLMYPPLETVIPRMIALYL